MSNLAELTYEDLNGFPGPKFSWYERLAPVAAGQQLRQRKP